ncbi:MAG: AIR carboxylase family protein [FCB group bacterium]|nr:AIR carboxylase family protein [FCB group bacterium]
MKVVIIMGSAADQDHALKITTALDSFNIPWEQHVASAHKNPREVLAILDANKEEKTLVYVTIAGRSNTRFPVSSPPIPNFPRWPVPLSKTKSI